MGNRRRHKNGSWGYGPLDGDSQLDWISMELTPAVLKPIRKALKEKDPRSGTPRWRAAARTLVVLHQAGLIYDEQPAELAELAVKRIDEAIADIPNMGWVDDGDIYVSLIAERDAVESVANDLRGRGQGFGAHVTKVGEKIGAIRGSRK